MSDTQSYSNHAQIVTGYHKVLPLLLLIVIGVGLGNLHYAIRFGRTIADAALILLLAVVALMLGWYLRIFALKAQDRAIRAEENLRHFALTGSLLDPRLTIRQIIGLRFASDAELADLARRAAEESMSEKDIKKAVTDWRPDTYRV